MPSIKLKKKTQEYLAEKERSKQNIREPSPEPDKVKKSSKDQKSKKREKPEVEDVPLVFEKRKRTVPPGEQKLYEWLDEHVESREGACVSFPILFEYFTDFCAEQNSPVTIESAQFNRVVKDKFGKEVGIKESSPYKGLIKEVKAKPRTMKVKAESLNMKMKDIIEEVLNDIGNPTCGIRFPTIKIAMANKYPALQVDLLPHKLLVGLERGIYYGKIELVKGTGKCGYYRLYGVEPRDDIKEKEEKEKEKERQRKEEKLQKKKEKKDAEKENKGAVEETEQTNIEKPKKKGKKRKAEKDEEEEKSNGEPQKKKKKKKRTIRKPKWEKGDPHSNPEKIEDTFHLAFTYSSEPKEASFRKIVKYLMDHYPSVNVDTRLKPALDKGIEKGIWEQSSGNSIGNGSFRLLVDDFDPESNKTVDDMICQAIVASHEPKQATVIRIKQYIMDYHPEFNVESRPYLFKKAVERALKKGVIKQLTGIGMSGTFQLAKAFIPSPGTLAGSEEEGGYWVDGEDKFREEKYVVRKTKSGRYAGKKA